MKKAGRIILIAVSIFAILLTVTCLLGAVYLMRYKDCSIDEELLNLTHYAEKTEFYRYEFNDRENRLGEAVLIKDESLDSGKKYQFVPYSEIPESLINAFISVEDKRFFDHNGLDYLRTGHAAINYVFGKGDFGGSTITQQLVKNLTGHDEFSIERKITEAFCALDLEEKCDKTEILELYLNVINLSEGCRGAGAAADFFFSKQVNELTLAESATLAAITKNPAAYDPLRHPENNVKRRNTVLKCMLDQGYITQSEYDNAVKQPLELQTSERSSAKSINSWYTDMVVEDVISDLAEKFDISRHAASDMLYRGGFRIYTAMHSEIQSILEEYYEDVYNFPIDEKGIMPQSSMIVIDPYTGDILGVAGAVGQKTGNRVQNYATSTKRPPGSTIKPISAYALAIEKGLINWSTIIEDSPITIDREGNVMWPSNIDKKYVGPVDIQYALEHSLNTVAVKVLQMVGGQNAFDFLHDNLLIDNLDSQYDKGLAALALGQPSQGITLREITAAYSIFEEGIMSKPRSYFKVTDMNGNIILDNASDQNTVISQETAAIMTKLLETVVDTGTASGKITLDNTVSVAGKSGTSQNNCDRWFIGYTPELLAGVWFGYDYPKDLSEFGGNVSVYLWDEVMTEIYEHTEYGKVHDFYLPDTVRKMNYHRKSGTLPTPFDDHDLIGEGWFALHN